MSDLVFTIGGTDYLPYLELESLVIEDAVSEDGDSLECTLVDYTGSMPIPKAGQEVLLQFNDGTGWQDLFAGILLTVDFEHLSSYRVIVNCRCRSYVYLMNRKLVVGDFPSQLAGNLVVDIINDFAPGFTTANVQAGYTIPRQQIDYVRVGQALDMIAQEIEFSWYVDFNKDVHFFALEENPGILADLDYDNNPDYFDLRLTEDVSQIINRVYVKDVKGKGDSPHSMQFKGDGATNFFKLGYEPSELADASATVTDNTGTHNANMKLDDGNPSPTPPASGYDCYLCIDNWGVRIAPTPPTGSTINVSYGYLFPKIIVVEDSASIAEMAARTGTDGVFEHSISMGTSNRVLDEAVAVAKAQLILLKFAWPVTRGVISTYQLGWRPGMYFNLRSNRFRIANQPLNKKMYVVSTSKRIVTHGDQTKILTTLSISDNFWHIK